MGSTDPSSVAVVVVTDSADEVTTVGAVTWSLPESEMLTAWLELEGNVVEVELVFVVVVGVVVVVVVGVVVVVVVGASVVVVVDAGFVVVVVVGVVVVVVELVPVEPAEPVELVPVEPVEPVELELLPDEDDEEEAAGQPSLWSVAS